MTTSTTKVTEPTLEVAQAIATANGMCLIKVPHQDHHYRLYGQNWVIDLYPVNGLILHAGNRLNLPPAWMLSDAVEAMVRHQAERRAAR